MRRLPPILTSLLLLALAAAWIFGNGRSAWVEAPRCWVVFGANRGYLAAQLGWQSRPSGWKYGTAYLDASPSSFSKETDGVYVAFVRVPIWAVLLATASIYAWRWRGQRRRRRDSGFPLDATPASDPIST